MVLGGAIWGASFLIHSEPPAPALPGPLTALLDRQIAAIRESTGTNVVAQLLLLLGLFATFGVLLPGTFLQPGTMQSMVFQLPEPGLLSLGMAVPLVSGASHLRSSPRRTRRRFWVAWILTTQMPEQALARHKYWADRSINTEIRCIRSRQLARTCTSAASLLQLYAKSL